ncbi:hypothetical protein JOC27_000631 [Sporolactobacillus spathodeae]|uniref:Uncharacterized protein n=1 Tax=Sporolactobacillus spathodeae TaxID=1465502 RepID=A0ABS2Q602_9BACL|nr:hypothetical protein [Sporolactobacillus spathodeae]
MQRRHETLAASEQPEHIVTKRLGISDLTEKVEIADIP